MEQITPKFNKEKFTKDFKYLVNVYSSKIIHLEKNDFLEPKTKNERELNELKEKLEIKNIEEKMLMQAIDGLKAADNKEAVFDIIYRNCFIDRGTVSSFEDFMSDSFQKDFAKKIIMELLKVKH